MPPSRVCDTPIATARYRIACDRHMRDTAAAGAATFRRIPLERRIPALSAVPRDTLAEAGTERVLEEVTIE